MRVVEHLAGIASLGAFEGDQPALAFARNDILIDCVPHSVGAGPSVLVDDRLGVKNADAVVILLSAVRILDRFRFQIGHDVDRARRVRIVEERVPEIGLFHLVPKPIHRALGPRCPNATPHPRA